MTNNDYYVNQRIKAQHRAEKGDPGAQYHMYCYYKAGEAGLNKSAKDAKYWLGMAVEQEFHAAILELADLYSKGKYARSKYAPGIMGRSIKKDLGMAIIYFEKAVDLGDVSSLRAIYKILSDKSYNAENEKLAVSYMKIMAKKSWKDLKKFGFTGEVDADLHQGDIYSYSEEAREALRTIKEKSEDDKEVLEYLDGNDSPASIALLKNLLSSGKSIAWPFRSIVNELEKFFSLTMPDYQIDPQILECWRNEFTKTAHIFDVQEEPSGFKKIRDRRGSFLFGHPLVNEVYPWPITSCGEGLTPLVQIDFLEFYKDIGFYCEDIVLKNWLSKQTKDSKTRYLQVWIDSFFHDEGAQIRFLPNILPTKSLDSIPSSFISIDEEVGEGISLFRFNIQDLEVSSARYYSSDYFEEGLISRLEQMEVLNEKALKTCRLEITKLEKKLGYLLNIDYEFLVGDRSFFFGTYSHKNESLITAEDLYLRIDGGGWKSFMQISSGPYDSVFSGWSHAKPALMYRFRNGKTQPEFKLIFG